MPISYADTIDRIRPAIFQLRYQVEDLSPTVAARLGHDFISGVLGTGFLVGREGHAITALHVLRSGERILASLDAGTKRIKAGIPQPNSENLRGNFTLIGGAVVAVDERHDLALLKLEPNPFDGEVRSGIVIDGVELATNFDIVNLDSTRPKDGELVLTSGFPLDSPVLVSNMGIVASSWTFDTVMISPSDGPEGFAIPDVSDVYLADLEVNGGNSGGPVYLESTAVTIGVCVATQQASVTDENGEPWSLHGHRLSYSSGLTVVVPSRYVMELLVANGITTTEGDAAVIG